MSESSSRFGGRRWSSAARAGVLPLLLFLLLFQPDRFVGVVIKMAALAGLGALLLWSLRRGRSDFRGSFPGIRQLMRRGGSFVHAILLAMGFYGSVVAAMPVSASASHVIIDRFLLNRDFIFWALWQPCPAFYSAENRWVTLRGDFPPPHEVIERALRNDPHFIVHFPARVVFQPRDFGRKTGGPGDHGVVWDVMESRYRDEAARAVYRVEYEPGVRRVERYKAGYVE